MPQYPKPLSQKSIDRLYEEAGISPRKREFITRFLTACSALYGAIDMSNAWDVYKELSEQTETVKLKKKDLLDAASILRREEMPFYVCEIDELYTEERRSALDRTVVNKQLVSRGQGKYHDAYYVLEAQLLHPFYVPENMLEYTEPEVSEAEKDLEQFIGKLVVSRTEYQDPYVKDRIRPCCGKLGQPLNSFSYHTDFDEYLIEDLSGESGRIKARPNELKELLEEVDEIASVRLMKKLKHWVSVGIIDTDRSLRYLLEDFNKIGVDFGSDEEKLQEFIRLYMDFNNKTRLWCLCGWKPEELMDFYDEPVSGISLGPGIREAIENGDLDREELLREFEKRGLRFVDEE